jgi:ABC-type glycerol-3-phosphate transport system substrate-binding protein
MEMTRKQFDRRQFLKVLAGSAAGALAASCAPPATPAPTEVPAATAMPASSWQSPTFTGTLEYWDWAHPALRDHVKELIASYAGQAPNIKVNQTTLEWGDYQTKALAAAASHTGPDFSQVHQIWEFDMIRAGYLAPFPEDMTDWSQKFSTPFNRDPDTGRIYNYTIDSVTDLMFFNTEILGAEGIKKEDIPTKWDDFMKMAAQLTKTEGGKITQVGMAFNDSYARSLHYFSLIYQLGGWVYGEDRASALWNSKEGVEALKFVQDIYHTHKVDDPTGLGSADAFGNGQAAFFFSFGYYASALRDRYPVVADVFDAVSTPTFTGRPDPAWGILQPDDGFVVSADAPQDRQDAAFNFIALTSAGQQGELGWYKAMESVPDWKPLSDDPGIAELSHLQAQTVTMPWRVNIAENPSESDKFLQEMFDEVILNQGDVQAAADNAVEQMNAAFKATADKKRYILEREFKPPTA